MTTNTPTTYWCPAFDYDSALKWESILGCDYSFWCGCSSEQNSTALRCSTVQWTTNKILLLLYAALFYRYNKVARSNTIAPKRSATGNEKHATAVNILKDVTGQTSWLVNEAIGKSIIISLIIFKSRLLPSRLSLRKNFKNFYASNWRSLYLCNWY